MPQPGSCVPLSLCFALGCVLAEPLAAQVVINEIHYHPDVKTERAEFVELFNAGSAAVNLSGWRLAEGVSYTFAGGTTLSNGAYLVIAQDPPTVAAKFGVAALGPWAGSLDNGGDKIVLLNAAGAVEDEVEYQMGFPWPTVGTPPGYSIELVNPAFDNQLGGNWRASTTGTTSQPTQTLVTNASTWKFFRGRSEASSPTTAWRSVTFDDSGWESGPAPVGYEPANGLAMGTFLSDMAGNYTSFFMRRTFVVDDPSRIRALTLEAVYDDGFKMWINGSNLLNQALSTNEVPYNAVTIGSARENNSFVSFPLANPAGYLRPGTNVIAVQVHNVLLSGSSDCFFDARLLAQSVPVGIGPTPGRQNCVFAPNVPPQIRQVEHAPKEPRSGVPILVTAKVTDPDGVAAVSLQYQVVEPGNYIEIGTAAYSNNWTTVTMNDAGMNGDAYGGDSVFTGVIPATLHRRLVRYRITATDGAGLAVKVPYADDPQPNFAAFVYDGVPAWAAAVKPGFTAPVTFETNVMRQLPPVHLIAKFSSVSNATWGGYGGEGYNWVGTLVYDGTVYDHIHYRARGGVWRYAMVKNMWKFDLNAGHELQMRDNYGKKYQTRWSKLNLGACIQQGDYGHRGEQGMFESVGFRLFNLAGVPACNTSFLQFRVIDDALEADPATQYESDFWGLYLAVEQEDGRFLDEHELPDGNFYKMDSGVYPYPYGDLNNQGTTAVTDKSDLKAFVSGLNGSSPVEWWQTNWLIRNGCSYQAIVQGIHHYDIGGGKNYFYYLNPETRIWTVHPWDLDLTWANNMFDAGNQGGEPFKLYAIPQAPINLEYRNRVRELRDLLFNTDQAWQIIDEHARLLRGTNAGPTFLDADRCQWDYNPKMLTLSSAPSKARQGLYYQWPNEPTVSKDFNGCVQLMKNYVVARGGVLDSLAADAQIPSQPVVSYLGSTNYAITELSFSASAYSGANPYADIEWRIGEITDTNAPAFDPLAPCHYEITALWQTSGVASVTVPASAVSVGHAYRVRARTMDTTGRWSRWSQPSQFIAGLPENAAALVQQLKISELMYDPPEGSDYEFVELRNASTNLTLNLEGAKFTSGIDFSFAAGASIPPGGYLLLIRGTNAQAFRSYYGIPESVAIVGPYAGSLANDGEQLTLKTGSGGAVIASFDFGKGRGWPLAARGSGHSLVALDRAEEGQGTGSLDYPGNWRASSFVGGSPGWADPPPPAPGVLLNEVTAHTDYFDPSRPEYDSNDWIELYNTTGSDFTFAPGWFLSDDPASLRKWAVPPVTISARGWIAFDEVSGFHNPITSGFGIDKAGEQILLSWLPGGAEDRVVDALQFKGQENGVSIGRYPDGGDYWFTTLRTSNAANVAVSPRLVISELMYRPPNLASNLDNTRDEFVELFNPTGEPVLLQDTNGAWRIDGGIAFTFAPNTVVPAGGVVLVVSFDPGDASALAAFRSAYGLPDAPLAILGPYSGKLSDRSDRVALEKPQYPDLPGDPYSWVILDEVIYGNQRPWPAAANGGSNSLHRVSLLRSGNDPGNWVAAPADPGTAGVLDSDGDGMPDAWELQYSLRPDDPSDANADADGDGMTNLQEFLSGTNPLQAGSVLRFDSAALTEGTVVLTFTARVERSYTVQARANFDVPWETLTNLAPASVERVVEVSDPAGAGLSRFYRLVAARP